MKENSLVQLDYKGTKSKDRRPFCRKFQYKEYLKNDPFRTFEGKNFLTTSSVVTIATD